MPKSEELDPIAAAEKAARKAAKKAKLADEAKKVVPDGFAFVSEEYTSEKAEKTEKKKRSKPVESDGEEAAAAATATKKRRRGMSFDDAAIAAQHVEELPRARRASMDATAAKSAAVFCAEHDMRVSGPSGFVCPAPMTTFTSTPFVATLTAQLTSAGFTAPTNTQQMAWPIALSGANMVTVAKTGSGKTLGFLLPVFHALHGKTASASDSGASRKGGLYGVPGQNSGFDGAAKPSLLVMAPTRELACQIEDESNKFGAKLGLKSACLYGGAPKGPQCRLLRMGVDVVIGTPGRLQDMLTMGVLSLDKVKFLVLDEADRMLDMGFEDQIRGIIAAVPVARQTLLFTATWPKAVKRLADEFCPNSVQMSVGNTDVLAANISITQHIEIVKGQAAKAERLEKLFMAHHMEEKAGAGSAVKADHGKAIVFVKFKQACNRIAQTLWDAGFSCDTLHGDMDQRERTKVIDEFKASKLRVLVATDVAARGLDVKDVTHVYNYDFPFGRNGVEDYVHRIGRTGRAGATGSAFTFFDPAEDAKNASGLVAILVGAKQVVPDTLQALARGGGSRGGRGGFSGGRGGYSRGGGGGGKRW